MDSVPRVTVWTVWPWTSHFMSHLQITSFKLRHLQGEEPMNEFGRRNWEHTAIKTKCAQTRNWNTYDPQCWKGRCWLLDQARTGFLGPVSRSHVNGEFLALIGGWNGTESPDTGRIISQSSSEPVRLCQRLTPEFQGTPGLSGVPNFVYERQAMQSWHVYE